MPLKVTISPQLFNVDKVLKQRVAIARNAAENLVIVHAKQSVRQVGGVASGAGVDSIRVLRRTADSSIIGSDKVQMAVVETGRKPGKVPRWEVFKPILARWAAQKGLSIPENKLYLVARKIAREGIKGRFPFKKAAEIAEAGVIRIFKRAFEGL